MAKNDKEAKDAKKSDLLLEPSVFSFFSFCLRAFFSAHLFLSLLFFQPESLLVDLVVAEQSSAVSIHTAELVKTSNSSSVHVLLSHFKDAISPTLIPAPHARHSSPVLIFPLHSRNSDGGSGVLRGGTAEETRFVHGTV